ncbi:MAG: RusA family crossover junction endodeoxyribonuclease [Desulfuromonadales bacterium]|nr:RusA family crossover junction endodeoxyribonuclease [Desulfuromonadales bacterium]
MILELPWPPSVNHYWGSRVIYSKKHRRHIVSKYIAERGKKFRSDVIDECLIQGVINKRLQGPLSSRIELYPPKNFRYDQDNFQKALFDALTHAGVYEDDSQIDDNHVRKMHKVPGGKVIIEILPFSNPHSAHNQMELSP